MNRNERRKAAQRRNVLLVVALMLVICIASVGGTIAWLQAETTPVVNTFAPSNMTLTLVEAPDSDNDYTFKMVPGTEIGKNPKVTLVSDVKAYLFVEVTESCNVVKSTEGDTTEYYALTDFIAYDLTLDNQNSGWTKLELSDRTVYYTTVEANAANKEWSLLGAGSYQVEDVTYSYAADHVETKVDVTKEMMAAVGTDNRPTLSFKAYAIQFDNIEDTDNKTAVMVAWELASAQQ